MLTAQRNRGSIGFAVAVLASALLAGCRPPEPRMSPGLSSGPGAPQPSPATAVGEIELHALDPRFVPNLLRSANGQLLWSSKRGELWRYVPGGSEPERLFASANGDAAITDVVASSRGYAFVETSPNAYGDGGWRVWYLPESGGQPVELDRGRATNAGFPPTLTMDDSRVVWAGFDEPDSGWVSRLRMASLGDPDRALTLLSFSIRDALLWYPCLHGNELWFAIIHPDFEGTGTGNEFHIEVVDLSNEPAAPVRFAGTGHDFNPAVNDDFIVWKTAEGDSAALNWGTIHVQARGTQSIQTVPVPNGNRPSIGDRFVAFDEITHSRLDVYDPTTRRVIDLAGSEPGGPTYGGLSISGDLLTWFTQGPDGAGLPQIGWAMLSQ
jgi:hypothetical protein